MASIRSLIVIICILLIGGVVFMSYYETHRPQCTADQIKLYTVAVAYPGMSQSHTVYAVINHGEHTCQMPRTPYFDPTQPTASSDDEVQIKPLSRSKKITWGDITWFSVHANSACSQILTNLPKQTQIYFNNGLALALPTAGYPCQPHVGKPLSTGLTEWKQAKQCRRQTSQKQLGEHVFLSDDLRINLGQTLVCD